MQFRFNPVMFVLIGVIFAIGIYSIAKHAEEDKTPDTSDTMRTIQTEDGTFLVKDGPLMFDKFHLYMTKQEYEQALCEYPDSSIQILGISFKPKPMFENNILLGLWLESDSMMLAHEAKDYKNSINQMVELAYGINKTNEITVDWTEYHPIDENVEYFNVFYYKEMWVGFGYNTTAFNYRSGGKTIPQIAFLDHDRVNENIERQKQAPYIEEAMRFKEQLP